MVDDAGVTSADAGADVDGLQGLASTIDPKALGRGDFSRLVAALLRVAESAPSLDLSKVRERLVGEIFDRMSSHIRPARAKNQHAVVHWRLSGGIGDGGYDRYETVISNGSCTVSREVREKAKVTITVGPTDFIKLITHQATPAVLFVTGKIKVKGDLAFAAGLIGLFDLPKPG